MKLIRLLTIAFIIIQGIALYAENYCSFKSVLETEKFGWNDQGGANLIIAKTPEGKNCIEASGNGQKAYGGLRLNRAFDLSAAKKGDHISLNIKQNVSSGLYISIRNSSGNFYKIFKVSSTKWNNVKVDLDITKWNNPNKVKNPTWGKIQNIAIYSPSFRKKEHYIKLACLKVVINGSELKTGNKGVAISSSAMKLKDSDLIKVFKTSNAIWAIDLKKGAISGVWRTTDGKRVVKWCENFYNIQSLKGDFSSSEDNDRVIDKSYKDGALNLLCKNKALPQLIIYKKYWVKDKRLKRELKFKNLINEKLFITPNTEIVFEPEFRNGSYYLGGGYLGPLLPSSSLKTRQKVTRFKNTTKAMILSNSGHKGSFANYRNKLNGKFIFPWWQGAISGYNEKANALYYTPDGWEMSLGTIDLKPSGGIFSVEDVFTFFPGNWFDFLNKFYVNDEVVSEKLKSLTPAPEWLKNVKLCMMYTSFSDVKNLLKMTNDGYIMILISRICANWTDYRVSSGLNGFFGGNITGPELKALIDKLHKLSPRIKVGLYQWVSAVSTDSPLYKEHPEWFRKEDRYGNEIYLFPGYCPNYTTMINRPTVKQAVLKQFKDVKDYLNIDYIYLDETKTMNQINWKTMELLRDDHWYDLWEKMRKFTDKQNNFPLFFNGRGNPFADVNYIEAYHQLKPDLWRDFCGIGLATETFLKHRKGCRIVPLYWTKNVDYINRVLALGWIPSNSDHIKINRLPFINAAYEINDCNPIDAKYSPDWKNNPKTEIESYAVKRLKGHEIIFSFINRSGKTTRIPISIDLSSINIKPEDPVFIWGYRIDNINSKQNPLSSNELIKIYRTTGWRENLITSPRLLYAGKASKTFKTSLNINKDCMFQIVISKSGAGIYSSNGKPQNYFFRNTDGVSANGCNYPLQVESRIEDAEIILFGDTADALKNITVNGKKITPEKVFLMDKVFPIIKLGKGSFKINAVSGSRTPKDHINFTAKLKNGKILVTETSNKDIVYALISNGKTLYTGTAPISIPSQRLGGNCLLKAVGYRNNGQQILIPRGKGTMVPKNSVSDYHPVDRKIHKLNENIDDALLLGTATETGLWKNRRNIQPDLKPFMAKVDVKNLTLTAGTTRKIEDFTGSAFAGFKFKDLKKLKIKLNNTFYNATGMQVVGHLTKYRRSKREFAGFIVDYHSDEGYVKRVAFSVGVKNPKCNTTNPSYGKGSKPDQFVNLGNLIDHGPSKTFTLDLAKYAPQNWDGTLWFSVGTDWMTPDRRLSAEVLEINSKVPDNEINTVDSRKIYDEFQRNKIIKVPFISNFKWENDFDSKEWEKVKLLNNFFLLGGTALPRLKTSVRLAYDKNNLFFAFRSDEKFRKYPLSSTGSIWNGDSIEIYILPDRGKMLQVIADAQGEQNLLIGSIKNTNIKLKLKKKSVPGKYWEIKLAIPFELIGDQPNNNWKINICRNRPPGNGVPMELSTWAPVLKKFNEPENFAKLVFEKNEDNSKIIIKNYGKGGKSSGEILKYILPQVLKWKPQLTVLMAGTNDMLNPGKFAGYNEFEKNMQQIIYRLKSNNGKIILLTIPPCIEKLLLQRHPNTAFKNESPSQKIIKANKIIKSLAKRNNIPVVDVYDIIKERGPLNDKFSLIRNETNSKSKDGVHPTAEGYRMIAKAVAEIVRKNNLPIRKIACLGDSITYGAHMKGAGTSEGDTYPGILSGLLK